MGLESQMMGPSQRPKKEEIPSLRERVPFYHTEPIMKALDKLFPEAHERVNPEVVKDIFYAYLEQKINNTQIYTSPKYKVSFPYSVNNTADLAKTLYEQYTGSLPIVKTPESDKKPKDKEYLFANFFSMDWGSEYTFQEEFMHEMVQGLPAAMESIKKGEVVTEKELYTLGPPTNVLSTMSQEFLDGTTSTGANLDTQLAKLYTEFIESDIAKEKKPHILLRGLSMSASFAVSTAEKLRQNGLVTQDNDEYADPQNNKPFMQVRIDTPPAQNNQSVIRRALQAGLGITSEGLIAKNFDEINKAVKKHDLKFLQDKNAVLLEEKGIKQNNTPEQEEMKKKFIWRALLNLVRGVPVPKELKITEVIGTHDQTMWSPLFNLKLLLHKSKFEKGDIRRHMMKTGDNRKTFGVKMPHFVPYLRKNELERIKRAADALLKLKQ